MMNKVILMGRLTKDPELRHTNSGTPVCSFSLAVNQGYGDKEQVDFINCTAWNKTAEFVVRHFFKGKMLALVGRISSRSWEDSKGQKRYATEVIAQEISFCGDKLADVPQSVAGDLGEIPEDGFVPLANEDLPF